MQRRPMAEACSDSEMGTFVTRGYPPIVQTSKIGVMGHELQAQTVQNFLMRKTKRAAVRSQGYSFRPVLIWIVLFL